MFNNSKENGFTMTELVVVIAIIGITLAIAIPSFLSYRPTMRIKGAARDISSILQSARMKAVTRNTNCNVVFTLVNNSFTQDCTNTTTSLPDDISFGWGTNVNRDVGGDALPADGVAFAGDTCNFTSGGTANAGTIYITNTKNESYAVTVSSGGRIIIYRWDPNQAGVNKWVSS